MMKKKLAILLVFLAFGVFTSSAQNWSLQGNTLSGGEVIGSTNDHDLEFITLGNTRLVIKSDGNVGIGTYHTTGFRLSVEGRIRAREVFINLDQWADFVFEPDYRLLPLEDLGPYVRANRHLPGLPAGEDVIGESVAIGHIQWLMLQKIEELTLYIITLHDRVGALENQRQESQYQIRDNE